MARYSVDINANITGFKELDNIEKQIKNIQGYAKKPIDINFKVDTKNVDISKQMTSVGKSVASAFAKGFLSFDNTSIGEFIKFKQQALKELNELQSQISKITGSAFKEAKVDENIVNKWATEYINSQQKSFEKIEKEAIRQQQTFEKKQREYSNAYYKDIFDKQFQDRHTPSNIQREMSDYYTQLEKETLEQQQAFEKIVQKGFVDIRKNAYQSIGNKSDIQKKMSEYYTNLEKEALEQQQTFEKKQREIHESLNNYKYDANISKMSHQLNEFNKESKSYNKAEQALIDYKNSVNILKKHFDSSNSFTLDSKGLEKEFINLSNASEKFKNSLSMLKDEGTKSLSALDASILGNKIQKFTKENTRLTKNYIDTFSLLESKARSGIDVTKEFKETQSKAAAEGLLGRSSFADFKRAFSQIFKFATAYGLIQRAIYQVPRQIAQNVLYVDNAMTNLQMATGITNDKAQDLMKTYSQLGNQLKATGTDVAASATEWMKQGKSIAESQELAKDSIILSKIGGLSAEESTKTITAAMKSYDLDESEVMGFIDKISAIDMASATDVGGLANAFNKVAANARNAGIETEKILAYAATIGETTQEGMDSVGTSLNSIFSRMGNIKLSRLKDPESGEDLNIWGIAA